MDKRTFLKQLTAVGITTAPIFKNLDQLVQKFAHFNPEELAKQEDFWLQIRAGYRLKPDYINLENGYYCHIPQETLENYIHHIREINYQGSWYMRTAQWDNKDAMAAQLAELVDCRSNEVIITRNTTESLDTIIGGFPWKEGDEAIIGKQDYGSMRQMFQQISKLHGVQLKEVSVPNHPSSDEEIVKIYEDAITPKTRLMMVCHIINITGHILPIRKICDMAHRHNVEVMVDGAHAVGHFQFSMKDLDCDYYGSSLHKWLSVPLGSGLLFIKKEKIAQITPRFADWRKDADDIRRLNHTGTHPVHTDLAVGNALEYYHRLGGERKEVRLRHIQNYWVDQVRDLPHILLNTPKARHRSCGIANVGIKGMKPHDLAKTLLEKYRIWTVAIDGAGVHKELDVFVKALKEMS